MKRTAFAMKLKPGMEEEYKKRHDEIWPELKKILKDAGIYEYSIFFNKVSNTLFAFQKTDGESGSQDLGNNEIVQKWWNFMADIMETNPDNSPVTIPMEELFYLE